MKHNAERAVNLIQQALREVNNDISLNNVRNYLYAAFNELTKVDEKRKKREIVTKNEENTRKLKKEEVALRIKKLDEMLQKEKEIIDSLHDKRR